MSNPLGVIVLIGLVGAVCVAAPTGTSYLTSSGVPESTASRISRDDGRRSSTQGAFVPRKRYWDQERFLDDERYASQGQSFNVSETQRNSDIEGSTVNDRISSQGETFTDHERSSNDRSTSDRGKTLITDHLGRSSSEGKTLDQERFSGPEGGSLDPEELGSPSELAWQAWLLVDAESEDQSDIDSASLSRRITPKSVFIAPSLPACAEGYHADLMKRCVKNSVRFDSSAHNNLILERLNALHAKPPPKGSPGVGGPLQVNIPLLGVGSSSESKPVKVEESEDFREDRRGEEPEESVEISTIREPPESSSSIIALKNEFEDHDSEEFESHSHRTNETERVVKIAEERDTREQTEESVVISVIRNSDKPSSNDSVVYLSTSTESLPDSNPINETESKVFIETKPRVVIDKSSIVEESANDFESEETKIESEFEATSAPLDVEDSSDSELLTGTEEAIEEDVDQDDHPTDDDEEDEEEEEEAEESVEISMIEDVDKPSVDSSTTTSDAPKEISVTVYELGENATESEQRGSTTFFQLGNGSTPRERDSIPALVVPVAEFVADDNETFAEIVDYKIPQVLPEVNAELNDRANSIHDVSQDHERRKVSYSDDNPVSSPSPSTKTTNASDQLKNTYWWLPPGWRVNSGSETTNPREPWDARDPRLSQRSPLTRHDSRQSKPTLLRFWTRMPLVRDPSIRQLSSTSGQRYHRRDPPERVNFYKGTLARDVNRVVGPNTRRTLGG